MGFVRGGSRIAMLASYYVVHDVHAVRQRIFFATRTPLRYCSSLALTTSRLLWSHGRVSCGRCCRRRGSCTYEQGWLAASATRRVPQSSTVQRQAASACSTLRPGALPGRAHWQWSWDDLVAAGERSLRTAKRAQGARPVMAFLRARAVPSRWTAHGADGQR